MELSEQDIGIGDALGFGVYVFKPNNNPLRDVVSLSQSYITNLEECGYEELATVLKEDNYVQGRRSKRDKKTRIGFAVDEMSPADHIVADHIVSQIDPEIWDLCKSMMIPGTMEELNDPSNPQNMLREAFLRIWKGQEPVMSYKASSVPIIYSDRCLFVGNELMVQSDQPLDILEYVMTNYPGSSYSVFKQLCEELKEDGLYPRKGFWDLDSFKMLLSFFREGRALCKSLNKITKVNQLAKIDYDNPYNWLDGIEDVEDGSLYVIGDVPLSFRFRYPRLKKYNVGDDIEDDAIYFSDLVEGDTIGAVGNSAEKMKVINHLYEQIGKGLDITLLVHMFMSATKYKGVLVRKPRPHNLCAIVQLDPCARDLKTEFEKRLEKVYEANVVRNMRFFNTDSVHGYKDNHVRWKHLEESVVHWRKYGLGFRKYKGKNHGEVSSMTPGRPAVFVARSNKIRELLSSADFAYDDSRYFKLSLKVEIGGLVKDLVPLYGSAWLAVNSTFRAIKALGFDTQYIKNEWRIVKH